MDEGSTNGPEKSFVRRNVGWLLLLAVVVALAVPKVLPLIGNGGETDAADAAAGAGGGGPRALPVSAYRVAPRPLIERLATTGSVRANEQVELVSEIAGKVERIAFAEGQPVAAGALLVKIDDAELLAQREQAAQRLELARSRERRQRRLLDEGILSQQEYDLQASQVAVLEAELALIAARLEKTEIRAPFGGIIGLRRISEGSYLSPQTVIATLQDLDPVKIDFALPERYASVIRQGGEIEFMVKGSDQPVKGVVFAVEPSVDPETRSLSVRARSANPDGLLLPGSFADVELVVRQVDDALAVPAIAVIPELGGRKVFVVEDGVAQPRQVTTGLRTESFVEVTSGLAAGDRVLTSGLLQLSAGKPVEIVEERSGDDAIQGDELPPAELPPGELPGAEAAPGSMEAER